MSIKEVKTVMYETSDGQRFDNEQDAVTREGILKFKEEYDRKHDPLVAESSLGIVSSSDLVDYVLQNLSMFTEFVNSLNFRLEN